MKEDPRQRRAPLLEEMLRYTAERNDSYHTPGHKNGRGLERQWAKTLWAKLDLTEVPGFDWETGMQRAQELAADFFGADQSLLLTQGATQGILAGIMGAFHSGQTVLVGRNCHVSVINGLILADLNPVFVETEEISGWHIPAGVSRRALEEALRNHPGAAGCILTNPTYQGVAEPAAQYRQGVGSDRIVMIDEAHGGHFGWSGRDGYDARAIADLWVQGTHKIHGSLTQTGWLHLRRDRINPDDIEQKLGLVSSTSPSYILAASLDSARRMLATGGSLRFGERAAAIDGLKDRLASIPGVRVLQNQAVGPGRTVDPWKITLSFEKCSGFTVSELLRRNYRIQAEYADPFQITFIAAPWQTDRQWDRLYRAIRAIRSQMPAEKRQDAPIFRHPGTPPRLMGVREAAFSPREWIAPDKAGGRIAAGILAPYPPGIPWLVPGERIEPENLQAMEDLERQGGWIRGLDPSGRIPVIRLSK